MAAPQTSEWVLIQIKPEGPLFRGAVSAELIRQALRSGKLSWTDMVFAAGRTMNWTQLCDIDDFRNGFPQLPDSQLLDKLKKDYYLSQNKGHVVEPPSEIHIKSMREGQDYSPPPLPVEME